MASILKVGPKWRALVRRVGHKPICKTHSTKAAAEAWARRIEAQIDDGKPVAEERSTIGDLIDVYRRLRDEARPILDTSTEHYTLKQLKAGLCDKHVARLTPQDLVGYCTMRRDEDGAHEAKRLVLVRERKDPRQKAGNDQWVPLLGEAWMVLKRQPQVGGEARIFPIGASTVSKYFTEACMKMSIPDLHFHDLRHEGTSQLFEEGYEIQQVASVTGHKDWRHLRRYTNLKPEDLQRAIGRPAPSTKAVKVGARGKRLGPGVDDPWSR